MESVQLEHENVFEEETVRFYVNVTGLITRENFPITGIRARFFSTNKFNAKYDFVMWCGKIKAILVQNKIAPAISIPGKYPESWTGEILAEKLVDAHSYLTLHLKDNVLREINETDNAYEIWTKLEKLYLGKSLSNKIY
ncbi:hypothetical protein M9H77_35886 [Catharanthus roseus]|uniref:Uncharacterized protein n=1 Tax=Catharanthus roseus TaxID=4058 RepID=A0ACB9ZQ91_CATRO|nr:hypothetical protein M9H77_35886 [Catharanthus roseus]